MRFSLFVSVVLALLNTGCDTSIPEAPAIPTTSPQVIDTGDLPHQSVLPDSEWQWFGPPESHPKPGTVGDIGLRCRNGSATGFAYRAGKKPFLLLFLRGGGACQTERGCLTSNADRADMGEFINKFIVDGYENRGVMSTTNPDNPFRDWHVIVAPYCTGDVHCGSNPKGVVPGSSLQSQMFVGADNVALIARYASKMLDMERVVLAGSSAGGYGAIGNWSQVQNTFGDIPVDMLSGAAPIHPSDQVMTDSLENHWRTMWDMSEVIPTECLECNQVKRNGLVVGMEHILAYQARQNPDRAFSLVTSTGDCTMRGFHRLFNPFPSDVDPDCRRTNAKQARVSHAMYRSSVYHLRDVTYDGLPNVAMFIPDNTDHGHLLSRSFGEKTAGGVLLHNWLSDFVKGEVYTTFDMWEGPTDTWTVAE